MVNSTKYGRLTILEEISKREKSGRIRKLARVRCDCGNVFVTRLYSITQGFSKSCGCLAIEILTKRTDGKKTKVKIGERFNYLIVLKEIPKKQESRRFLLLCDCGKETESNLDALKDGRKKSCGCYSVISRITHGLSRTSEYHAWKLMKARCYNPKNGSYPNYGVRGISVCSEWLEGFENFFKDMGFKPSPIHSIDRVDNDGNYCKENCKWSTPKEQYLNRRARSEWKTKSPLN